MQTKYSRRAIVRGGLIAGALLPAASLLGVGAQAAALPALDPADPTAKALGFVTDASKVDAAANPTYKPAQKCGTCAQFPGQGNGRQRGLQHLRGQECAERRLVQGLGTKVVV